MGNYKIAMATFGKSKNHDGDQVLKWCEWRCHDIKKPFRQPKHMKEHIKKDSQRNFANKFRT